MLLRALLLLFLIALLARAVWRVVEGVVQGAMGGSGQVPRGRPSGPTAVKMARCPVCGTYVVPGSAISGVHRGQAVYFCSDACRAKFAA